MSSAMNPPPGDAIFVAPIGGGANDWVRMQSIMTFWAGKRKIAMLNGTWRAATKMTGAGIPNQTQLYMVGPGVRIVSTIPYNAGDPFAAAFHCTPIASATNGVLSANVTDGSIAISSSISMAIETRYRIESAAFPDNQHYFIVRRPPAGAGPFTINNDRPVKVPFTAGDVVRVYTSIPENINIYGNGASISGLGSRYFGVAGARFVNIYDLKFDPNDGTLGAAGVIGSYDIGCYNCTATNLYADWSNSPTTISGGILYETAEGCSGKNIRMGWMNEGAGFYNCIDSIFKETFVWNCANYGFSFITNSRGNKHCIWEDGAAYNCGIGLNGAMGDDFCVAKNIDISYNTTASAITSPLGRFCMRDIRAQGNTNGIIIAATSLPVTGYNWDISNSVNRDLDTYVETTIYGLRVTQSATTTTSIRCFAGTLTIKDLVLNGAAGAGVTNIWTDAVLRIDRGTFVGSGGGVHGVYVSGAGAYAFLTDYVSNGGVTNDLTVAALGTARRVGRCVLPTVNLVAATSHINYGAFVLVAGVFVVPFRDLQVGEAPKLLRVTNGGGTVTPLTVSTPGTGFTSTGALGDGDGYQWEINT